jgi:hypothetical protein
MSMDYIIVKQKYLEGLKIPVMYSQNSQNPTFFDLDENWHSESP